MLRSIKNLAQSNQPEEKLSLLPKTEKVNLIKKISARISALKQCKKNLLKKTNFLIKKIENLLDSSLKELDSLIASLIKLITKEKYNFEELIKIDEINSAKIFALPPNQFNSMNEISEMYKKRPFIYKPIDYDPKNILKNIKKRYLQGLTLILRSQDRSFYVTGGYDGVIRTWDKKGNMKNAYYYEQNEITALALSADRKYIASGARDGSLIIINLDSPHTPCGAFNFEEVKQIVEPPEQIIDYETFRTILSVSISSSSKCAISCSRINTTIFDFHYMTYKILSMSKFNLASRTDKTFDNDDPNIYCAIRDIGNNDYVILMSKSAKVNILKCNPPYEEIKVINLDPIHLQNDDCKLVFTKSSKYFVVNQVYQKIIVFKLGVTSMVETSNNCSVGVDFDKSNHSKILKIDENKIVEEIFISEQFKFIAVKCGFKAYVWNTMEKRLWYQWIISEQEEILCLSHSFLFLTNFKNEILCWNLETNQTRAINYYNTNGYFLKASVSKDLKLTLLQISDCLKVLNTQTNRELFNYSIKDSFSDSWLDEYHNVIVFDHDLCFKCFEIKTGYLLYCINALCTKCCKFRSFMFEDRTSMLLITEESMSIINFANRTTNQIHNVNDLLKKIETNLINKELINIFLNNRGLNYIDYSDYF